MSIASPNSGLNCISCHRIPLRIETKIPILSPYYCFKPIFFPIVVAISVDDIFPAIIIVQWLRGDGVTRPTRRGLRPDASVRCGDSKNKKRQEAERGGVDGGSDRRAPDSRQR